MDRKELIRQYKETPRPAGVYRVVHTSSGRTLFGSSFDAPAMLNRVQAQLKMRGHPNPQLSKDWAADGEGAFVFEVLDLLTPSEGGDGDLADDLRILEALWVEKLGLGAEALY
ncbi:MAG: GIY-YIG nuclease family protein [Gemmatimonadetes bacterium]|jgi:hypothetical protein|nr:GIY-YIG nuclease family protein [Gemmatimonadota bacterium]